MAAIMAMMSMDSNGSVIHSSLLLFKNSGNEFPNSEPMLGCLIRRISENKVDFYFESPVIVSPGKGEKIEIENNVEIDILLREKLIEIAESCREKSGELLRHADRLEEVACRDGEILQLQEPSKGVSVCPAMAGKGGLVYKDVRELVRSARPVIESREQLIDDDDLVFDD